ncbi:eukaryotic translation initiation factor 3 subunit F [Elysia marginata]|uniref:Eukaryotic translation initiation factor 3 subunit F n=1 Tax=Elysia marginata TaxID=1093978 RepID=A0AAV4GY01_9GAST|nr:eukaryotic translation initiation factor 3 subunit F [Elysia marginata]
MCQQLMKRKLRYAGHIMRGSSGPLLKLSLEGTIEGKRGQGRPRRNWMDDVNEWSGSTSYGDTKRKAENREDWRDMVANLQTEDGT